MPLSDLDDAVWLNEPPEWTREAGGLRVVTGDRTDFWQDTWYGFQRDDGHFLGCAAPREFTAEVAFEGGYKHLYDQAGLMARADATHWIKLGVEFTDGAMHFSIVVTDGASDWSVVRRDGAAGVQAVRLTLLRGAALAQFRDGAGWTLMRLAPFAVDAPLRVGPMACSPERSGFRARFTGFEIGPPNEAALHG